MCPEDILCSCVGGRVVVVTAELHTLAAGATPDYKYGSSQDAYNRRSAQPVAMLVPALNASHIPSSARSPWFLNRYMTFQWKQRRAN